MSKNSNMTGLKLGLIGTGIGRSRAPELHRLAGRICGIELGYELIDLASAPADAFDATLEACRAQGYRGVNVTHPYKERALAQVHVDSDSVRRLGAVNTVLFGDKDRPMRGFNTDYTGFMKAFAARFPGAPPGRVAIIGAGGVGRAIAFGLVALGARAIRLFDEDAQRCARLAESLRENAFVDVIVCERIEQASAGADGLVNATPVGMHKYPGTPLPGELIGAQSWAFDAVYTPAETRFLRDARSAGLEVLGGYELFFHQGVDAFGLFTGVDPDEQKLRDALDAAGANAAQRGAG